MHMATGVRTPDYKQFHLAVCTAAWDIEIIRLPYSGNYVKLFPPGKNPVCIPAGTKAMKQLAQRDGFTNENEFWQWFIKPFRGRIIFWDGAESLYLAYN